MNKLRILAAAVIGSIALATIASAFTPPLGFSIFPLTFVTQPVTNLTDTVNELIQTINAQVVGISTQYPGTALIPPGGTDTSQVVFSSAAPQQNPLVFQKTQSITVAALNAGGGNSTLVFGQTGRTMIPTAGGIAVMAQGGNAATCQFVNILCSPSGLKIASWVTAQLVSGIPVTLASASSVGNGAMGCLANDSLATSNTGSACTTSTGFTFTVPYTVQ